MEPVPIADPADPRVDDYRLLTDARARRRMEAAGPDGGGPGFFVAEGASVVERLVASGRRVRSVLVDGARLERLGPLVAGLDAPVYVASPAVLRAVAGFDVHRGALACADRWPLPDPAALLGSGDPAGPARVAILEGINDHENLGGLFRNAAGLGMDAVLLCPRCCDPLYRRSVRVSMGHVLSVPWTRLEPWPASLARLGAAGFTVVALTPGAAAEPIDAFDGGRYPRLALLIGAEGPGLSDDALAAADHRLRIPMRPGVDSLNVASAAAVAFFALGGHSRQPYR